MAEEVDSHLRLAEKFSKEGKLEEAFNEYEQAVKFNPGSPDAQAGLRQTRSRLANLVAQMLQKGRAEEKRGNFKAARDYYQSVLESKSGDPEAVRALENLESSRQLRSKRWWAEAREQTEAGRLREAAGLYRQIGDLAEAFSDSEWQEKAFAGLNQVNERKAQLIQKNLAEGKRAFDKQEITGAQKAFNQVLALDPQNRTANEYVKRITGSESLAKVTADKVKEIYYRGVDLYGRGEIEEAIKAWREVLALEPENTDARINIERAQVKLEAMKKFIEGR